MSRRCLPALPITTKSQDRGFQLVVKRWRPRRGTAVFGDPLLHRAQRTWPGLQRSAGGQYNRPNSPTIIIITKVETEREWWTHGISMPIKSAKSRMRPWDNWPRGNLPQRHFNLTLGQLTQGQIPQGQSAPGAHVIGNKRHLRMFPREFIYNKFYIGCLNIFYPSSTRIASPKISSQLYLIFPY